MFGSTAKKMTERISLSLAQAVRNMHSVAVEGKMPLLHEKAVLFHKLELNEFLINGNIGKLDNEWLQITYDVIKSLRDANEVPSKS